jgi:hypothetical protein
VDADDPAGAMVKALATLRAAIHAIGDATPGWETKTAVMHVAPANAADRLLTVRRAPVSSRCVGPSTRTVSRDIVLPPTRPAA